MDVRRLCVSPLSSGHRGDLLSQNESLAAGTLRMAFRRCLQASTFSAKPRLLPRAEDVAGLGPGLWGTPPASTCDVCIA